MVWPGEWVKSKWFLWGMLSDLTWELWEWLPCRATDCWQLVQVLCDARSGDGRRILQLPRPSCAVAVPFQDYFEEGDIQFSFPSRELS